MQKLVVQHLIVKDDSGDLETHANPEISSGGGKHAIACGLEKHLLGETVITANPGIVLLHTGTDYPHLVSCKKCKATDAYKQTSEGDARLGRAEDYLELPAVSSP